MRNVRLARLAPLMLVMFGRELIRAIERRKIFLRPQRLYLRLQALIKFVDLRRLEDTRGHRSTTRLARELVFSISRVLSTYSSALNSCLRTGHLPMTCLFTTWKVPAVSSPVMSNAF